MSSGATKGKQGTKGQKQIYEENQGTLNFYLYMTAGSAIIHFLLAYLLFNHSTPLKSWIMFGISLSVQGAAYQFMRYMARSTKSQDGKAAILDAGIDLNMEGGLGEYCKDIIILTSGVQLLSLISTYLWWLYIVGPLYAIYLLWTGIIAPWIFAPAPEEDEKDEKRRKKKERKMVFKSR